MVWLRSPQATQVRRIGHPAQMTDGTGVAGLPDFGIQDVRILNDLPAKNFLTFHNGISRGTRPVAKAMRGTNSCGTPVITAALVTLAKTIGQSGMSAARRRYRVYGTPKRSKRKKMTPQPNASIPKRVFPVARIATGPRGSPATQPGTRYEHPRGKAEV